MSPNKEKMPEISQFLQRRRFLPTSFRCCRAGINQCQPFRLQTKKKMPLNKLKRGLKFRNYFAAQKILASVVFDVAERELAIGNHFISKRREKCQHSRLFSYVWRRLSQISHMLNRLFSFVWRTSSHNKRYVWRKKLVMLDIEKINRLFSFVWTRSSHM